MTRTHYGAPPDGSRIEILPLPHSEPKTRPADCLQETWYPSAYANQALVWRNKDDRMRLSTKFGHLQIGGMAAGFVLVGGFALPVATARSPTLILFF
jgi:hypothetical protein